MYAMFELARSWNLTRGHHPLTVALCFCGAIAAGCSSDTGGEHQSNLRGLAAYYSQYKAKNRGQVPPSEKVFKDYIAAELSAAGAPTSADKIDAMFVSNRDGKPFVVHYGGDKAWAYADLLAYEQEGRDGIRHVAYALGGVESVSEEQFGRMAAPSAAKR
jgi:hypothetical protein